LEYFGSVVILPKHMLAAAAASGDFAHSYATTNRPENIVGSGPFRLKEFNSQRTILLERNPEFWTVDKQGRRLPYFDEVQLTIASTSIGFQSLFIQGTSAAYENIGPEAAEFQKAA